MQLFPEKYRPHIKPLHLLLVSISGILILAGAGSIVISGYFSDAKKLLGGLVIFGLPTGSLLLALAIGLVSRTYNKAIRESLGQRKGDLLSNDQRAKLIRNIVHLKYDYRNSTKKWFKQTVIGFSPLLLFLTAAYIIFYPRFFYALFLSFIVLWLPLFCCLCLWWLILIRPKRLDSIELGAEGIHYRSNDSIRMLPWHKAREIQFFRGGCVVKSDDDKLIVWSDIEPTDCPPVAFFKSIFHAPSFIGELILSVQTLAPHIYQKEPFLAQRSKLPISDKIFSLCLGILIFLFLLLIVAIFAANIK